MTLRELAKQLGAELVAGAKLVAEDDHSQAPPSASLTDDPAQPAMEPEITGVASLESAGPLDVSFLDNPKYTAAARLTRAGAVLVELGSDPLSVPTLQVHKPYLAFAKAVGLFYQAPVYAPGIHPSAMIDPTAELGPGAHIGAYVVVGSGVRLGAGAVLLPHVVLYNGVQAGANLFAHAHAVVREGCVLGDAVILGNGVVVGSDGFGFAKDEGGRWYKIPQSGRVVIGSHVEIQANSCIDRASVGETSIAEGAKLDNLVQVGHGSQVGEHTLLCAQVGLAGSSRIGRHVILAGQVGVAGHLTVGDGAIATAQSGIPADVPPGELVSGYPAISNRQWLRASAVFARLPDLLRRLQKLERRFEEASNTLHQDE